MAKNPYTVLIDKLNQLQGAELQTASNLLDQLIAGREPEIKISKEDLRAIADQRNALGKLEGCVKLNLVLTVNFLGEVPEYGESILNDVGYEIQGKTKLEKEVANLVMLDDWDLLNCLREQGANLPEAKAFYKKVEELENQIEKLAEKYGLDVEDVVDQINSLESSKKKQKQPLLHSLFKVKGRRYT